MDTVYRARDLSTRGEVALKQLQLEASTRPQKLRTSFEREYRTLRSLRHPRIIEVYDFGIDPSGDYYTMELLSGRDLSKLTPIPYAQACRYLRDVAS